MHAGAVTSFAEKRGFGARDAPKDDFQKNLQDRKGHARTLSMRGTKPGRPPGGAVSHWKER